MKNSTNTPVGTPRKSPMTHLPPAKKGKGAKLKAKICYGDPNTVLGDYFFGLFPDRKPLKKPRCFSEPVLVIPLGEVGELRDAISEIVAIHIATAFLRGQMDTQVVTDKREDYQAADEILAQLGLPRARLGKGRK